MKYSRPNYKIRCKDCGYETDKFHGWVFVDRCDNPGKPSILHNWEKVK